MLAAGKNRQLVYLTLYNEEAADLRNTLLSLANNRDCLSGSSEMVVVIVADGKDRISESSKQLLCDFGLVYEESTADEAAAEITLLVHSLITIYAAMYLFLSVTGVLGVMALRLSRQDKKECNMNVDVVRT